MLTLVIVVGMMLVFGFILANSKNRQLEVVKAGKVDEFYPSVEEIKTGIPETLYTTSGRVSTSRYKPFSVHGNSMKNYNINDRDIVFVKDIKGDDKYDIKDFPVLVFNIVTPKEGDAKYKLRKFISYIDVDNVDDNIDWNKLYDNNESRIRISKEEFVSQCQNKWKKIKNNENGIFVLSEDCNGYSLVPANNIKGKVLHNLVLSETYNGTDEYSLHPTKDIYGEVKYASSL